MHKLIRHVLQPKFAQSYVLFLGDKNSQSEQQETELTKVAALPSILDVLVLRHIHVYMIDIQQGPRNVSNLNQGLKK